MMKRQNLYSRSPKARKILSDSPGFMLRYGTYLIIILIVMFVLFTSCIKYKITYKNHTIINKPIITSVS